MRHAIYSNYDYVKILSFFSSYTACTFNWEAGLNISLLSFDDRIGVKRIVINTYYFNVFTYKFKELQFFPK